MLPDSWTLGTVEKGVRSFNAENLGFVGERAAFYWPLNFENDWSWPGIEPRLNAIAHNLGGMAKAADFFLRTPTLASNNFAALWSTNPKFSALKDLNSFSTVSKVENAGNSLKAGFALSKWPHLHRGYLVTVYNRKFIAVESCRLRYKPLLR